MSLEFVTYKFYWLFVVSILLFLLLSFRFFRVKHSALYAVIFSAAFMTTYKHGIVRADMPHITTFVSGLFVYLSVYVMFMPSALSVGHTARKLLKLSAYAYLSAMLWLLLAETGLVPEKVAYLTAKFTDKLYIPHTNINPLLSACTSIKNLATPESRDVVRTNYLPEKFTRAISDRTAAVYPWELSYLMDIGRYKYMPVPQAYTAYTPWLDAQNANFFADDNTAPDFVIMNMRTIDGRFALVECPLTWTEIFTHYSPVLQDGNMFLLERGEAREFSQGYTYVQEFSGQDIIPVPDTGDYCMMKADIPLNFTGQLARIFYKIPPLDMCVEFQDGRKLTKRVLAEQLAGDTLISPLPTDDASFLAFMTGDISTGRVKSISFTGQGRKFYSDRIGIVFTEIKELPRP